MADGKYQVPRGTQDIYGDDMSLWQQCEQLIRNQCELYGYKEVRTPVFEHTEVFKGINDSSDMVNKEMYSFKDNGQRDLTLRPEGTKGIIRSFVEHKMYGNNDLPVKMYYMESMFRYDRPQKGRYRQFNQFGIEAIGIKSPLLDVEAIDLGYKIVNLLGIKNVVVLINTLGDKESRMNYRQALKDYFAPYLSELCSDCQRRYQQNPLRILDCKVDKDHPCFKDAPKCRDYLNDESKEYFDSVLSGLDKLSIPYKIDDHLVRGLDYYTNTVFEAVPMNDDGQQSTLFAGGQYDGLVESFGGPQLCGVGFGMGMERVISLANEQGNLQPKENGIDTYVITLGEPDQYGLEICQNLRKNGISVEMNFAQRGLKSQFKSADRFKAKSIIIIGESEKEEGLVQIKNTLNKEQYAVKKEEAAEKIKEILKEAE